MTSNLGFAAFIVERERSHKMSVTSYLDLPLKKISNYYLNAQELHQYTPESHPDNDKLKVIVERLKEQTSLFQHGEALSTRPKGN